jgi:hypothetical protein
MKKNRFNILNIFAISTLVVATLVNAGCINVTSKEPSNSPKIAYFKVTPETIHRGAKTSLYWKTQNADRIKISGIGNVPAEGSREIRPNQQQTYKLVAKNDKGTTTRNITVRVTSERTESSQNDISPCIINFTTTSSSIRRGEKVTLKWRVKDADRVEISGIGGVSLSGSRRIAPRQQTTYTLTARNDAGTTTKRTISVRVNKDKKVPIKKHSYKSKKTNKTITAPKQISPVNGARFNHYPRKTKLRWKPVKGASSYTVQIQYQSSREWHDLKIIEGIKKTIYTFNFVGSQPGRWSIWAVNSDGKSGYKSGWRNFYYTR